MNDNVLKSLFKAVFDKDIHPQSVTDRILMKSVVYLCQDKGIIIDPNYHFISITNGWFLSQQLDADIKSLNNDPAQDFNFSDDAKATIAKIKDIIAAGKNQAYNTVEWLVCICSLVHITKYVLAFNNNTQEEALKHKFFAELSFKNKTANEAAYEIVSNWTK